MLWFSSNSWGELGNEARVSLCVCVCVCVCACMEFVELAVPPLQPITCTCRSILGKNTVHVAPFLPPSQVGTLVFDPLLDSDSRESIYVGGDSSSWASASASLPSPQETPRLRDPMEDVQEFKGLWSVWSSLVERGLTL